MRKLFIAALLAIAALAVAAVAWGETIQEYEQTFTVKKEARSTGTDFHAAATDPDNPEGQQPKAARRVEIKFPRGTRTDTRAAKRCSATDADFNESGEDACPTASRIGDGEATVRTNTGTDIEAEVTAYNRRRGLILYVVPQGVGNPIILRPVLRRGPVLDTRVPPNCVLGTFNSATNQCELNGERSSAGEAILTRFDLETVRRSRGRGDRRRDFIRTPRVCPRNKRWVFAATFTYADGTKETKQHTSPCRR